MPTPKCSGTSTEAIQIASNTALVVTTGARISHLRDTLQSDKHQRGFELEHLLDRPPRVGPPSYDLPQPRNIMDAVEQGNFVAEQERRRLSLGHNPIPDMSDLINSQNIWASGAELPDDMSGLFLQHSSIGLFILVNFGHPHARKRFSYAHEYAHALLDRRDPATVSREENRRNLSEV